MPNGNTVMGFGGEAVQASNKKSLTLSEACITGCNRFSFEVGTTSLETDEQRCNRQPQNVKQTHAELTEDDEL